jgi:hypothetical protein
VASSNRTFTASFAKVSPKFEVRARVRKNKVTEAAHITGEGIYEQGEMVSLEVVIPEDVTFVGWVNQNGQIVSRENPFEFAAIRNIDLEAIVERNLEGETQLVAYPNPSNGIFKVNIESEANVEVFNSNGVLVQTLYVEGNNQPIDIRELSAGIYILKITTAFRTSSVKVILR